MNPALSPSGIVVAVVAAALIVAGALLGAWPLLSIGCLQASALLVLYVLFVPHAALLRRRQLEVAWWVPAGARAGGALIAGRPATLHLLFRNLSPHRFGSTTIDLVCSGALRPEGLERDKDDHRAPTGGGEIRTALPPTTQARLRLRFLPLAAGYWFFHGLRMRVSDRFGLFAIQLYFPNLLGVKVFPPLAVPSQRMVPFRPRTGASHERVGRRLLRQRGLGSDLRELRDHTPGDPFKRIAWKATARTGKLMVREFESEVVATQWLLLDISPSMRRGHPGATKLDYGLGICSALARQAVEAGDRVGLVTFDTRIYSQVQPRDGRPQLYQIVDRLMELHNVVDEDLTDLTDAELHSAVAEFLAYQEGVDVRVRRTPPRGSPLWDNLVQGVDNELIDLDAMVRAVKVALRKADRRTGAPSWWSRVLASTPAAAQLRLYCRLRGLEVPYRRPSPLSSKHTGMADALALAARPRDSRLLVLISDLEGIGDRGAVLTALGLARRRNHSLVVIAPYTPAFLERPTDSHAERIHSALALRHQRRRATVKMAFERLGVPVFSASPDDGIERLLSQMQRHRRAA